MEIAYESYLTFLKYVSEAYKVTMAVEHKCIHEFSEGPIPLFKIIFGHDEKDAKNKIFVSFHIDISSVDAILWWNRFKTHYYDVKLMESYMKDDRGETFVGQTAEIIHRYKLEQEILSNWASDKSEAEKYAKEPIYGRRDRVKQKAYLDLEVAKKEFLKMKAPEGEESH